jgi:hypothetical protein
LGAQEDALKLSAPDNAPPPVRMEQADISLFVSHDPHFGHSGASLSRANTSLSNW